MSTSTDVEKGMSDEDKDLELAELTLYIEKGVTSEENRALLGAKNEVRQNDREHPNRTEDIELAVFKKTGTSSNNITKGDVISDLSEGSNVNTKLYKQFYNRKCSDSDSASEESNEELQKLWDKNTSLIDAIITHNIKDVISLLENGASPNATNLIALTSACHIAASSNEEALRILLDAGAERRRFDSKGSTPLHYAAWTNSPKKIAMILGFPEGKHLGIYSADFNLGLTNEVAKGNRTLTPEQETEIQNIGTHVISLLDSTGTPSGSALPDEWKTYYKSKFLNYTGLEPGCSALHAASKASHPQCVRLLLAAGANPNLRDRSNSTPLDVAGALCSDVNVQSYVETLQLLRKYGGSLSRVESLVLERALRKRSLQALTLLLDAGAPINHRNPSGYTPMHLCVELRLKEHLQLLANYSSLEMDYRAVDVTDEEGSTVLHWAARDHWSDGVAVALLARAEITDKNSMGDTALHLAAKAGDYDIVKQILDHDANRECDFSQENVEGESPFSNAILSGNADIVRLMLALNNEMRDYCNKKVGDLTPLEYAAEKKFQKLFILLLSEEVAFPDRKEMFRIVNIIAKHNLWQLFSELENNNYMRYVMKEMLIWNDPLHTAIEHSSREMIIYLLAKGTDLSKRKNNDGQTAISLLMHHVTKPTEFLTEVLDECINTDKNIYDKDCVITINYSVLKPVNKIQGTDSYDMRVLGALIETGDAYGQRSLLTHPVVESFLYLKWKKCAKFIYFLISTYVLFLISFNTYIATVYHHMDHKIKEQDIITTIILYIYNPIFWKWSALFTLCLFSLVDLLFWTSSKKKWYRITSIWVKLLLSVFGVVMIFIPMDTADNDIIRGIAVITVCLSWIYLMMYISWTPTLGYFMQMYGKVSMNVIKVMLSFSFPLVGFSICFTILLRSKEPFDSPIAAFIKTMVMMSSEFEYESLVENSTLNSFEDRPLTSVLMLRIVFLLFFICVAIVLMNLMQSVAITDLQELSHDGKQRRLMKQVECISVLEKLFKHRLITTSTYKFTKMITMEVNEVQKIKPDSEEFGAEIKEIILNKAQRLIETKEKNTDDIGMKAKIDDMYDLTMKQLDLEKELSEIRKTVNKILEAVAVKDKVTSEIT